MKTDGTWVGYWRGDDFWRDSPLWRVNAERFFRRAGPIAGFGKQDSVLDVGCGPGHLESLLAPLVKEILAVDVAEQFVRLCGRNCRGCGNVETALLGDDYTNLRVLGRRFSLILCVSVVQYYRDLGEIESLIRSARDVALPGARLLIADLPLKRGAAGFTWDALGSLARGLREGYLGLLLRTAAARWLRRSGYREFSGSNRELSFTMPAIMELVRRLGLEGEILRSSLTIYANRPSLLIRFPERRNAE